MTTRLSDAGLQFADGSIIVAGGGTYNPAAVAITGGTISGVSSVAATGAISTTGVITGTNLYTDNVSTSVRANSPSGAVYLQSSGGAVTYAVATSTGLAVTGTISTQQTAGLGSIILAPSGSASSGFAAFFSGAGNRQGYIGISATNSSLDTGTIPYIAGTHAFSGNVAVTGALSASGLISPQQATTAAAPAYVKGAMYFDTTLNKLRIGGATAWETVTSA